MSIQGLMDSTFGQGLTPITEERPRNWRQGILMRFPNGHAPLTALTSAMRKKVTDDPEFNWWERELTNRRLELSGAITDVATVIPVEAEGAGGQDAFQGGAFTAVNGSVLRAEESGELILVTTDPTVDTSLPVVTRGYAGTTNVAINPAVAGTNPNLLIIGNVHEEGADTPTNVRKRAHKRFNYTQIFRNSLKATRTAMKTRLRTVAEVQDAKKQALLYHSIDMEWGFMFGVRFEGLGSGGQPQRMTDGIISQIESDATLVHDFGTTESGLVEMDAFEEEMLQAFQYGAQEKMAFCGNRSMLAMQQMARYNSSFDISPQTKEFGMNVRRFFSPYGTLVLKTHPLFNENKSSPPSVLLANRYYGLDSWMVILDMANLTYRPLTDSDTRYLPNRQNNGIDGLTSEYLTEAGMELNTLTSHRILKAMYNGAQDT